MSPFTIVVIMFLTVLFIILSVIPLLSGPSDVDSSPHSPVVENKITR
jgi:hypothetical protein